MAKKNKKNEKRKMKERLRKRVEEAIKKSKGGTRYFTKEAETFVIKKGVRHLIDIIPFINAKGEEEYKKDFWVHRNIGPENKTIVCLKTIGKKCPICEKVDDDNYAEIGAKPRTLYNVIECNDKKREIKVWDISYHMFERLMMEEIEEQREEGNDFLAFADLEDGASISFKGKEKTFKGGKFVTPNKIEFQERDEAYDEEILEEVHNLDEILEILPYKKIKTLFRFEEGDEEDEKEPEDDDEEENDNEEDGEEEEEDIDECPYEHEMGKSFKKEEDCSDCEEDFEEFFSSCKKMKKEMSKNVKKKKK